jgi:hypothetical protein
MAIEGAKRYHVAQITIAFQSGAEKKSGVSSSLIEAIAYLESWGDAKAESPAGLKGSCRSRAPLRAPMGLKVVTATRYKVSKERLLVPAKGKAQSDLQDPSAKRLLQASSFATTA